MNIMPEAKLASRSDLAGTWMLSFDEDAAWQDAVLHLPGTPLDEIDTTPPSAGWNSLEDGTPVTVPCVTDAVRPGYHGVSWWSRDIELRQADEVRLLFRAARLMVEIYLDQQLIGYDLEGYTPFEVIIPAHLATQGVHRLDVRVTNPGGSDNWEDLNPIAWAGRKLPSSQDFGGIWQTVFLEHTHGARIDDLWVRSNPSCDKALVEVECDCKFEGSVRLTLVDPAGQTLDALELPVRMGRHTVRAEFDVSDPPRYDIGQPNLHRVCAELLAGDAQDAREQAFGFRVFDHVDDRIELNGREIYMKTAISWSMYSGGPTADANELADEVDAIAAFGQNALTAHRRCANPELIDALERQGLLLYQEPGGLPSLRSRFGCGEWMAKEDLEFALELAKERVRRLALRDRSRACLVWWNLANECLDPFDGEPGEPARELMRTLREVDDSRLSTWTSAWNPTPMLRPFRSEEGQAFDLHGVLNWPSMWNQAVEAEIAAIRPPGKMVAMAGESQNFTSLSGVSDLGETIGPDALEGSLGHLASDWSARLQDQLTQIDPDGELKGPAAFCEATARVQGHGVARLALHHRANPQINGLAINGWHSHHRIGTMGITTMDRKPSFDPDILAQANAPIQLLAKGIAPVLGEGVPQACDLVLIDDDNRVAAGTRVSLRVTIEHSGGEERSFDFERVLSATPRDRVKNLGVLELGTLPPGNHHLEISGVIGPANVRFSEDVLVVKEPDLQGRDITLYDPIGDITPFFETSGARLSGWRLYQPGRPFISVANTRTLHTIFGHGIERAVFILRSTTPRSDSLRTVGDLEKITGSEKPIEPVKVLGHWIGGWGFTLDDVVLPSLGAASVWDWRYAGIFPQHMITNLPGRTLSGACSFKYGDVFETGDLTMGATATIVEAAGTKALVTTLPLVEAYPTSPLARRLIAEMVDWLGS